MLAIAVPNAAESGVFQFVKVALSSMISMFGTYQIAANGIAQSFWSLAALVGVAMGPVFVTVIGQCMGAGDTDSAEYYFKKLLKITVGFSVLWEIMILAATPFALKFYSISSETRQLVFWLVLIHNLFNALAFPFADSLGRGLRACGDVKFPTGLTMFTTICVRLTLSILLAKILGLGVIGIAIAMASDWIVRGIVLWIRFQSGRWKSKKVISECL